MYFAAQLSNNLMRIYEWEENSSSPKAPFDVPISPTILSTKGNMICPSPGGFNWCERADYRMIGGIYQNDSQNNGHITFFWNAGQGGDFPFPHIDAATFNANDMSYIGRPLLWSPNNAWLYAFLHPNPHNSTRVGITAFAGSGNIPYPSIAVGTNNLQGGITSSPWNVQPLITGNSAPGNNKWGDYLRIHPFGGSGEDWISSGYILKDGNSQEQIRPIYTIFGINNSTISNATTVAQSPGNISSKPTENNTAALEQINHKFSIKATNTLIPGSEYSLEVNNTKQLEQQIIFLIQSSNGLFASISSHESIDPLIQLNIKKFIDSIIDLQSIASQSTTNKTKEISDNIKHTTEVNSQICSNISWFKICIK